MTATGTFLPVVIWPMNMAIIYGAIPATFAVTAFRMIQNYVRVDEDTPQHDTTAMH